MAKEDFREGIASQEKHAKLSERLSKLSPEELQQEKHRYVRVLKLSDKLAEKIRKERPGFRDSKKAQLEELCKKALDPSDTSFCMICLADLEYEGNDKKCRVYCPDCDVDIEFTDIDKFKAETKID